MAEEWNGREAAMEGWAGAGTGRVGFIRLCRATDQDAATGPAPLAVRFLPCQPSAVPLYMARHRHIATPGQ